jgi:TonB family protein
MTAEVLNAKEVRKLSEYPADLRIDGVEGTVIMSFQVDPSGEVNSVITLSSPHNRLTTISERVLKAFEFKPGTCDSVAVSFSGSARNSYRLSR